MMETCRGGLFFSAHADINDRQIRQGLIADWPHGVQAFLLPAKSTIIESFPLFRKAPVSAVMANGILLQKKLEPGCCALFN